MTTPGRTRAVELDLSSSTPEKPFAIITADCSGPREIDDGLFVQPLDAASELYRVGVCVADTSKLYDNGEIRRLAMSNGSAKYWDLPNNERGYDPMIPPEIIKGLEFTKGSVRDALILTFLVGRGVPPTDLEVLYGKVQVTTNLNYKEFADRCNYQPTSRKFAAASTYIREGLKYNPGGDHTKALAKARAASLQQTLPEDAPENTEVVSVSEKRWLNGARCNEAFMIAANHLVGKQMHMEGRPAIYRLYDPLDTSREDFVAANLARYGMTPGRHAGLNLDPICRVTSPLRRLEDYMMSHQLRQRHLGREATRADVRNLGDAVRRLNQEIAIQALRASGLERPEANSRPYDSAQVA